MRFDLNFDDVERADNGNTTYYGGSFSVNGKSYPATGNDRGRRFDSGCSTPSRSSSGGS